MEVATYPAEEDACGLVNATHLGIAGRGNTQCGNTMVVGIGILPRERADVIGGREQNTFHRVVLWEGSVN
jgi:hypothetical protein